MYKLLLLIGFLIFTGCAQKTSMLEEKTLKETKHNNKKMFNEEDSLIMFALRSEQVKDFSSAAQIFETLYVKSLRKEYMHRSLQNRLFLKQNQLVIDRVDAITNKHLDDFILVRLKIVGLIQMNRFQEAQDLAIALVEVSEDEADYILLSDIYIGQEKFDEAVKYLESGYSKKYSEKILDRMAILLYVNLDRKKDAIAYLETHTMLHACSVVICKRLISFYSNENNVEGLLSAYLRYYKVDAKPEVAEQIVQLYGYKKDYPQLILFLQESQSDDVTLLQLYTSSKNYTKAFPLAKNIYDETGEIKYLGESVIYEYEAQKDKNDKAFLSSISKKFEEVLKQDSSSLYLNYFGYVLIDHDIDVSKGIEYIKKALVMEPDSAYYLDSLAWGHYKLRQCSDALRIIKKVRKLDGGDDAEVVRHHELIKKCKGKNKQ
ncbi:MAG: hypothetical protein Q9M32_06925 [Sulfurimonas sp.]|nr:hypothetical protein [Sulfurimonas sp.]MDQ7061118.1 hypothetical protein [Sulfurimonas sp.]